MIHKDALGARRKRTHLVEDMVNYLAVLNGEIATVQMICNCVN